MQIINLARSDPVSFAMQKMFTVGQRKRGSQQMQKRKVGCTFVFCSQVAEMQRRKRKWEKTEQDCHRHLFLCSPSLSSSTSLLVHMQRERGGKLARKQTALSPLSISYLRKGDSHSRAGLTSAPTEPKFFSPPLNVTLGHATHRFNNTSSSSISSLSPSPSSYS